MSTPEFQSVIDQLWSAFEEVGIEDGYDIVEQVTLLLYVRRLDVLHTNAVGKARATGVPLVNPFFNSETDAIRWSRLKNSDPDTMFALFESQVVRHIRDGGGTMSDARFTIPSASALSRIVDLVDKVPYAGAETNGAVYEYLISKITTKNSSGGFPTPRHLLKLMARMTAPHLADIICDPASGSAGSLVVAANYLRDHHPDLLIDPGTRDHFERTMFHGFDNDPAFARMTNMNLLLHGISQPDAQRRDSLAAMPHEVGRFTLVLTNPPFNGSVEKSALDEELYRNVKSTTKAMLFIGRVLTLLQTGGRAAVILPEGVLFGATKAHLALRRSLVEEHKLDAVVRVPPASFEPFSSAKTAVLFFTKTGGGGTDRVWFYDIRADGYSLDKKRAPVAANDLPDLLARWQTLKGPQSPEFIRTRSDQSFAVPRHEIAANHYVLTFGHYQQLADAHIGTRLPAEILGDIRALNSQIDIEVAAIQELLA